MSKKFILYDSRAITMGTDTALVYSIASTLEEIRDDAEDFGDGVIYSYDVKGDKLINETFIEAIY